MDMEYKKKQLTLEEILALAKTLKNWNKHESVIEDTKTESYTAFYKHATFILSQKYNKQESLQDYNITIIFNGNTQNFSSDKRITNFYNNVKRSLERSLEISIMAYKRKYHRK